MNMGSAFDAIMKVDAVWTFVEISVGEDTLRALSNKFSDTGTP